MNKRISPTTYHIPPTFSRRRREAFTLIELVVFTAIFTVTIIAFISVLISITRTQVRQTSVAEVNQQSQFILQAVQYYVERSSLIETPANVATTTVKLRMRVANGTASNEDPITIFASGTSIYAQIGTNPVMRLTSDKVTVSNFLLTRKTNYPGKDSLGVSFNISYNTSNIEQQFAQGIQSAVSRVSAATFDSDVSPGATGYNLGTTPRWKTINGALYFNDGSGSDQYYVGIGAANPIDPLQVTGRLRVTGGDIYVDNSAYGVILKSAGGNCYRFTVSNSGITTTTSVGCP